MTDPARVPQHRRIEQVLRARIQSLQPGDRLPSDADLVAEFRVSRMTARNAMQRLADEGLVARRRGHGSFVAQMALESTVLIGACADAVMTGDLAHGDA